MYRLNFLNIECLNVVVERSLIESYDRVASIIIAALHANQCNVPCITIGKKPQIVRLGVDRSEDRVLALTT